MEVDSPWTCQCAKFASGECAAAWQGRCASPCLGPAPLPARTPGKEQHYTPDLLHAYAAHGRIEEAQQLLDSLSQQQASEECNRPNAWGMTPLHCLCLATASPSGDIFKLLMAAGAADVHARTARSSKGSLFYEGETPLTLAAQHSRDGTAANLVSLLLSCGADPLEPAGPLYTTALEYACAAGGEVLSLRQMPGCHLGSTHMTAGACWPSAVLACHASPSPCAACRCGGGEGHAASRPPVAALPGPSIRWVHAAWMDAGRCSFIVRGVTLAVLPLPAGIDASYLLSLAVAHGCTDVALAEPATVSARNPHRPAAEGACLGAARHGRER
jgi:hypothetical protein